MSGSYFFMGSNLEKCGKFWKNGRFSGRIRPDWGNTARADMAGLGSIGFPLTPRRAIYGLHPALAHNDAHISRLFVDCVTNI